MRRRGAGYFFSEDGNVYWGKYGAAGLLVRSFIEATSEYTYFLTKRADWVDYGGTWGIPSGAIEEGEGPIQAALREAEEEIGELPNDLNIVNLVEHSVAPDWTFTTVVAETDQDFGDISNEVDEFGWFLREEIEMLNLHPGFKDTMREVVSSKLAMPRDEDFLAEVELIYYTEGDEDDQSTDHDLLVGSFHIIEAYVHEGRSKQVGGLEVGWHVTHDAPTINQIWVRDDYQRRGLATEMLEAMEEKIGPVDHDFANMSDEAWRWYEFLES